jgi:hypothetical protein
LGELGVLFGPKDFDEVFVFTGQILPRQSPLRQKNQHIPKALQIITPPSFMALMHVNTRESRCPLQVLALLKAYVLLGVLVHVSLGEAKVDDIYFILVFSSAQHKIRGFYVVVQEIF